MLLRCFLFSLSFSCFSLFSNPPLIVQNLQRAPFLLEANAIAEASAHLFLFNMRSRDSALSKSNLGSCTHVFWWDDVTPLFEYSLQSADGEPAGYIILSGSKALPPVMEYASEGEVLSSLLTKHIGSRLNSLKGGSSCVKWYYFSPLELVSQISFSNSSEVHYFAYPTLENIKLDLGELRIERNPRDFWSEREVQFEWHQLENIYSLASEPRVTLDFARPVKYQQGCNNYGFTAYGLIEAFDTASNQTYCSPHCIAGCVPVAWAMEASAFKRGNCFGSAAKIWPNSSCWNRDWSSSTNPNICEEVSATIWKAHDYCSTSCDGSVDYGHLISGQAIFPNVFNLNYRFYLKSDLDFSGIQDVIGRAHQPFILRGDGQWQKYLAMHLTSFQYSATASPGETEGHAVLCYGYDSIGTKAYICMGWGSSFPDKWIDINSISGRAGIYVVSLNAEEGASALETKALEVTESH